MCVPPNESLITFMRVHEAPALYSVLQYLWYTLMTTFVKIM